MPYSGLYHFYPKNTLMKEHCSSVSMPYSGLYHFYEFFKQIQDSNLDLCQCPIAGFIISTKKVKKALETLASSVSMPYSGLYHFYPTLLRASIYAGLRAGFCTYFSELSEF